MPKKVETRSELIKIQHGSPKHREKGPPGVGIRINTESFSIAFVPPHIIDLHMKSIDNFMVMQLGPSRALGAFNSEKLRPLQLGPGYPIVGLTGSEFNCKATSTSGVIAFHFNDKYLEEVLAATNRADKFNFNICKPKFDHHLLQLFRLAHQEITQVHLDVNYLEHLLAASIIRTLSVYADITGKKQLKVPSAQLERAEEYIRSHLLESLRLHDLAKLAGMSQFHFARAFKAYFGISPYKYIQRLRLEKSIEILEKKDASIEEISSELGFSSVSNFGSFFKRHTGMSPGTYRQLYVEAP